MENFTLSIDATGDGRRPRRRSSRCRRQPESPAESNARRTSSGMDERKSTRGNDDVQPRRRSTSVGCHDIPPIPRPCRPHRQGGGRRAHPTPPGRSSASQLTYIASAASRRRPSGRNNLTRCVCAVVCLFLGSSCQSPATRRTSPVPLDQLACGCLLSA